MNDFDTLVVVSYTEFMTRNEVSILKKKII